MSSKKSPAAKKQQKPSEKGDIEKIFEMMDLNHDGRISVHELTKAAQLLGMNPTKQEAEEMIEECNPKEKGYVTKVEFRKLFQSHKDDVDEQVNEIAAAFRVFDKDNSGTISADEIHSVLRKCGEDVDEEEVNNMLKMVDVDGDGNISIEEFAAIMCDLN